MRVLFARFFKDSRLFASEVDIPCKIGNISNVEEYINNVNK